MRFFRIFLLECQNVLQERGRAFVWFLMAVLNPLILILFWKGAAGNRYLAPGWNFQSLSSYYFFLTIAFSLLVAHIEDFVSRNIKEGNIVADLVKPFSFFWRMFFVEFPYRLMQTFYACIICVGFLFFFGSQLFGMTHDPMKFFLSVIIMILGLFISFTMRMIMGIATFWFTDTRGFFEAMYATEFALGGTLIPLMLLPPVIANIGYLLPFSYIIYFPIIAIQGKLAIFDLLHVILIQILWLCALGLLYKLFWAMGIKKFSGVGQ